MNQDFLLNPNTTSNWHEIVGVGLQFIGPFLKSSVFGLWDLSLLSFLDDADVTKCAR